MGHSPSPERIKKVAYGMEEPIPGAFAITPHYNERGILVAFTVEDPEGTSLKRAKLVPLLHKEYPGVTLAELDNAQINYYMYRAVVVLRR